MHKPVSRYFWLGVLSAFMFKSFYQTVIFGAFRYTDNPSTLSGYSRDNLDPDENNTTDITMKNGTDDVTTADHRTKTTSNGISASSEDTMNSTNDHLARHMYQNVRILCWIMTYPKGLTMNAPAVNATWGKRCNKLLFMSDEDDKDFPAVGLNTKRGRQHLTEKTMRAFDYVYKNHLDDADWFLKADDDTYVIMENLRYMLSAYPTTQPIFFGHTFKQPNRPVVYFQGGAGYVLSKEALIRLGTRHVRNVTCAEEGKNEDVELGKCLNKLGVLPKESFDIYNKTRFHCTRPKVVLEMGLPRGFKGYDRYHGTYHRGLETISDYAISFHELPKEDIYLLEYLIYGLRPYGILNVPPSKDMNPPLNKTYQRLRI